MFLVVIDEEKCTGCGQCTEICPAQILGPGENAKAEVVGDAAECMGCLSCLTVCEAEAISVDEY